MARFVTPASTPTSSAPSATGLGALRIAALAAGLLGAVLVWGVGFASPSAIHNAAHDSRHTLAFPCH